MAIVAPGISRKSVQHWRDHYEKHKNLQPKKPPGRPPLHNEEQRKRICAIIKQNHANSIKKNYQIAKELDSSLPNCTRQTISRLLKKEKKEEFRQKLATKPRKKSPKKPKSKKQAAAAANQITLPANAQYVQIIDHNQLQQLSETEQAVMLVEVVPDSMAADVINQMQITHQVANHVDVNNS